MQLSEFDFHLPPELIAQHPAPERSASRLLVPGTTSPDRTFRDLPTLLTARDVLVFNNTKVIKARLFAQKPTGGQVEIMIERVLGDGRVKAQLRASHLPKPGAVLTLLASPKSAPDMALQASVLVEARQERFFTLHLQWKDARIATVFELIERIGHWPLPPYIARADETEDAQRYQTVYAEREGAVAAPTAGLHFDAPLMQALADARIATAQLTLHVGAGTFQPVQVEDISQHQMHSEWYDISAETVAAIAACKARGGRVIAVGTTSLRALESAAAADGLLQAGARETAIFITPGYRFRVVDALVTNFHLPKSTLLMLVSAFAGMETMRSAYAHAIAQQYRFFSYGDAMFLQRNA